MRVIELASKTDTILLIVAIVAVVIILCLLFLAYVMVANSVFNEAFKRPKPMPAVDRSPNEFDQSSIYGRGKNWFYANRMEYLNVRIDAFDHRKLAGYYRPSADKGCRNVVILLHGRDEHPSEMGAYAKLLMKELQCNVLIVHQRAHGMSEGKYCTYGLFESVDLMNWIEFCKRQVGENARIFIMGRCMGATSALLAAEQKEFSPNVAGIIADCPYSSADDALLTVGGRRFGSIIKPLMLWVHKDAKKRIGVDITLCDCVPRAGRIKPPVLIFQGSDDNVALPENTKKIYDNLRSAKRMVTIPGARHLQSYNDAPAVYEKEVRTFIEQCVIRLVNQGRM